MPSGTEPITSVGVDVGTTTTQVVVSRLRVTSPTHDGAGTPEIRDRTVVHRGAVHATPLVDAETVDIDAVAAIVTDAFEAAGIEPATVDTGAVIVTGETAKRRNAEPLVRRIAGDAGDFVAAAAGGSLEAVLAGRGSGAAAHAAETGRVVANVDIGGGTTNVAVFAGETLLDTRVLDVGARIVRVSGRDDGYVTELSPAAERLIEADDLDVAVGDPATETILRPLADAAASAIVDCVDGPPFDHRVESLAMGALPDEPVGIDDLVVTGGVGHLVNDLAGDGDADRGDDRGEDRGGSIGADGTAEPVGAAVDPFRFGDLGPLLATSLRESIRDRSGLPDRPTELAEDLRATVVGVGTESTTFSGRTIWLPVDRLPLRDVPVVAVDPPNEGSGTAPDRFERAVRTARDLYDFDDVDGLALYVAEIGTLAYDDLATTAAAFASAVQSITDDLAVVIVTRENCANVLGQLLAGKLADPVPVLDELRLEAGVRLDIGEPFGDRNAVPVVVKTLVFGG